MGRYISAKEAAEYLCVRPGTLYYWVFKHLVPCYKLRTGKKGKLLFKPSELQNFIEEGKISPNG